MSRGSSNIKSKGGKGELVNTKIRSTFSHARRKGKKDGVMYARAEHSARQVFGRSRTLLSRVPTQLRQGGKEGKRRTASTPYRKVKRHGKRKKGTS